MHILVVNDDGPPSTQSSPYVHSLVKCLQEAGHSVSVVLPHTQRSWIGKAHMVGTTVKPTYFRPGTLHKDDGTVHTHPLGSNEEGEEWVLVDGTPASCVQIGLYHYFKEKGPVDLVVSGPNYGRNTTAIFGLSSGTIGGALEGAICRKKAIAVSYAFFSRNHDPEIIAGASKLSVKLVEYLYNNWGKDVDLYSINVPLVEDVGNHKIMYADMLQNYWSAGSSFQEVEPEEGNEDPAQMEREIREEGEGTPDPDGKKNIRNSHKHFKWAPQFHDVYQSVEESTPPNDGWAVKEGYTAYGHPRTKVEAIDADPDNSVTALKANFMHAGRYQGEIKLLGTQPELNAEKEPIYALISYEDPYVQPLILKALATQLPKNSYKFIQSLTELPQKSSKLLQIRAYEDLDFEHILCHPTTSLGNAYVIRKALIRKHYLSNTVSTWITKHPTSILSKHIKPAVDFELDYAEFLDEALVEAFELQQSFSSNEAKKPSERDWWILKPGMSDRGQGIRLFSTEDELRSIFEEWEASSPDSDTEDDYSPSSSSDPTTTATSSSDCIITSQLRHFVAQQYIHPPLLLTPASTLPHKFHIRTYVLAVGSLKVYVYADMLALFAPTAYQYPWTTPSDMAPHLTNTCLQSHSPSPTEKTVTRFSALPSTLPTLSHPPSKNWKHHIHTRINLITSTIFEAAAREMQIHFQTLPNAFEVFGLDFLVDGMGEPWLLEVNAFPDFRQTGEELMGVVEGFWRGVVGVGVGGFFGVSEGGEGLVMNGKIDGNDNNEDDSDVRDGIQGMDLVLDIDLGRK
ncbi:MAG: hypothetical protein M1834_002438 [Cirrosporium novae-zelandiae]|nr:MAG: hypothetical protein M1834_002438 [Cirrosporium novae-zelandiae]